MSTAASRSDTLYMVKCIWTRIVHSECFFVDFCRNACLGHDFLLALFLPPLLNDRIPRIPVWVSCNGPPEKDSRAGVFGHWIRRREGLVDPEGQEARPLSRRHESGDEVGDFVRIRVQRAVPVEVLINAPNLPIKRCTRGILKARSLVVVVVLRSDRWCTQCRRDGINSSLVPLRCVENNGRGADLIARRSPATGLQAVISVPRSAHHCVFQFVHLFETSFGEAVAPSGLVGDCEVAPIVTLLRRGRDRGE